MILSFFLRGKEFHVTTFEFSKVYEVAETREIADNIVYFLADAIEMSGNDEINTVIFPAGPGSFTTTRIINSMAKGLYVVNPSTKFISVSSFLTLLSIARNSSDVGALAIPTMRGDYFTTCYSDCMLQASKIESTEEINNYANNVYFDNDPIFSNINLAEAQHTVLSSNLVEKNKIFVSNSLEAVYGFCPIYKF